MKLFNKVQSKYAKLLGISMLILATAFINSCRKDMAGTLFQVSDDKMIDEILESKGDTLSSFLKIIDISGLRGTIHAYGTYTLFAPTNEAVSEYLTENGLTLDNLSKTDAQRIVKYHLISDTLRTADFEDGRLPTVNFSKYYITTKTVSGNNSEVYIEVNREAKVIEKDLHAVNGYVHVIDHVLYQSKETIGDVINSLPVTYSLWKEAYAQSGIQDSINKMTNDSILTQFTIFIQSNDAFALAGITNMDELMAEIKSKNTSVTDEHQLLYNYIAYHITSGFKYVAQDLMQQSSVNTLVPGQVIVMKKDISDVLLNEFVIGGVLEEGVLVNRNSDYTDLSCSNGVVQDIQGNIQIVNRAAYRVYWDLGEQPEIMSLKGFRKAGTEVYFDNTDLAGIKWGKSFDTDKIAYTALSYPTIVGKDNNYVYSDYLRFRLSTNTIKWIEFTTPVLVPGTYKVWLSYRAIAYYQPIRTIFKQSGYDDQILGTVTADYNRQPSSYGLTAYDEEFFAKELLDGFRQQMINSQAFYNNANNCQALGIIQVYSTGQHVLRFEPLASLNFTTNWDQILFIPVDEDQIWPKQDIAGKLIYSDTPNCQIYPYSDCTTTEDNN